MFGEKYIINLDVIKIRQSVVLGLTGQLIPYILIF